VAAWNTSANPVSTVRWGLPLFLHSASPKAGSRPTLTRKPRTDAERNRQQLVTVAHAAFAADGLDLPIREIAPRAGLGVATVYRHFPARSDLISAVLVEQVNGRE
jgi:AcrR family transcriptional regulator